VNFTPRIIWQLVVAVEAPPTFLRGFDELEDHGKRGAVRQAAVRADRTVANVLAAQKDCTELHYRYGISHCVVGDNAMLPATIIQFVLQDGGLRAQGIAATSEVFNLIFACSLPGYILLAYLAGEIGPKIRPLYVLYAISGLAASLYLFLRVTTLYDLKIWPQSTALQ
jgi:hypothetical protein